LAGATTASRGDGSGIAGESVAISPAPGRRAEESAKGAVAEGVAGFSVIERIPVTITARRLCMVSDHFFVLV